MSTFLLLPRNTSHIRIGISLIQARISAKKNRSWAKASIILLAGKSAVHFFFKLMIDVGEPSSLWAVSSPGWCSWMCKKMRWASHAEQCSAPCSSTAPASVPASRFLGWLPVLISLHDGLCCGGKSLSKPFPPQAAFSLGVSSQQNKPLLRQKSYKKNLSIRRYS